MRSSDWSSDVFASDRIILARSHRHPRLAHCRSPGCARVRYIGDRNTGLTDLLENLLADHRLEHAAAISGLNVMDGDPGIIECARSEEHTSELQSLMRISYAVFCLKKKKKKKVRVTRSNTIKQHP